MGMESKKIIINSTLNVNPRLKDDTQRLTEEWIDKRIDIFYNYTLQSLKTQTNQHFTSYIRYDDTTEDLVIKSLSRYEKLPDNVRFVKTTEYDKLLSKELKGYEFVYFIRLDSDDMYHKTYVQQMFDYTPHKNTVALINRNGFIYDSNNKQLAKCYCKAVTFYTFIYKVKDYLEGKVFNPDSTDVDSEQYIALRVPHEFITKRNYLWHTHSSNTVTKFENWFTYTTEKTDNPYIINEILKEFIGRSEK
jgi:hypothetical protein